MPTTPTGLLLWIIWSRAILRIFEKVGKNVNGIHLILLSLSPHNQFFIKHGFFKNIFFAPKSVAAPKAVAAPKKVFAW